MPKIHFLAEEHQSLHNIYTKYAFESFFAMEVFSRNLR